MMNANLSGLSFGMEALEDQLVVKGEDLLGANQDVVMTSETVDIPQSQRPYCPEYPTTARRKGIEGYVTLSLLINDSVCRRYCYCRKPSQWYLNNPPKIRLCNGVCPRISGSACIRSCHTSSSLLTRLIASC